MAEELRSVLNALVTLSKVDASIARLKVERVKWEEERQSREEQLEKLKKSGDETRLAFLERKQKYDKEEKHLKFQQSKLVDRRKALTSLSNYKLQQAAEKEIDATARALSGQEEMLINMLDELDALESKASAAKNSVDTYQSEVDSFMTEHNSEVAAIDERLKELNTAAEEHRKSIDPQHLRLYRRASASYPTNPVVPFAHNSCGGCHMQLGPQAGVEIMRAEKLVTCRQCGRLLYLAEQAAD